MNNKLQNLKPWHKAIAGVLVLAVVLLVYYLIYIPKPTLELTETEGVMYGRYSPDSTLYLFAVSGDNKKAYLLEMREDGIFEERLPPSTYTVVSINDGLFYSITSVRIDANQYTKVTFPPLYVTKKGLRLIGRSQGGLPGEASIRIVRESSQINESGISIQTPPLILQNPLDDYTLVLDAGSEEGWLVLIPHILANWDQYSSKGDIYFPILKVEGIMGRIHWVKLGGWDEA